MSSPARTIADLMLWLRRTLFPFFDHRYLDPHRFLIEQHSRALAAKLPKGSRVLDAGAGECKLRAAYADHHYVGCDLAVGDSTWNYGALDCVCTLDRLPFRPAVFDGVLLIEVLEHLKRPDDSIAELARVLKPGGLMYLSTPFMFPLHQLPHDYGRYTRHGIERMFGDAGLEIVEITELGGMLTTIVYYLRWLFEIPAILCPSLMTLPVVSTLWNLALRAVRHPLGWLAEKLDPPLWKVMRRRLAGPFVIAYYVVGRRRPVA